MEDELRGRVEAVERTAAAAGHSDLGEEETSLENRMAELRQRENAILQSRFGHQPLPTLAAQEYNMGSLGSMVLDYRDMKERRSLFGMQQEVRILFSIVACVWSISQLQRKFLRSIINNSLQPINIMKLLQSYWRARLTRPRQRRNSRSQSPTPVLHHLLLDRFSHDPTV